MSRYSWLNEGPESSPITQGDLDQIETYADRLFAKVGIDVEFTQHFIDRVNDARNQKQISMAELTRLFKQQYKKNGKKIAQLGPGAEAVMKDMQTDVNMPFALVWDKQSQELDLIAKTVMRKKNFGTSNPVVAVEQVVRENKIVKHPTEVGAYLITLNDKEYKIAKHLNNNERHAGEWSIFTKSSSKFTGDEWEWVDTVYSRSYAIDRLKDFVSQNMKEAQNTLKLPNIDVGDEVMVGKFKNRKATVKGFDKDDNNQPVLKTNKGDQKLFKPRISKLMVDESVNYVKPQFDVEWEEANRYNYFDKLGQAGWEELASKGKVVKVNTNSVKKIGNTGADGSESLDDLEPDKVARLKKAMTTGTVEMPIVVKQPNGSLDLVAGNTRLIGLISTQGEANVWLVDASKLKEDKSIAESSSMMSSEQMLAKLSKEMQGTHTGAPDPNSDWSKYVLSHKGFTLKDIQVDKIPTSVKSDGMSQANIEKYKKADTAKFPPVVIGDNGYLLDGNHRLQAYKYQGIKTIKAYIGESTVVTEAFNNPYPINWFQKTQEVWEGSVQLPDGSKLFIDITDDDGEGYYNIEFSKSDTQGKGATMKATGTGDEFRIFATVQAGILEWWKSVDEDDVQKITFNASKQADDSKNRYKLYARFAKQWASKIGWVATSREEDGGMSFVLLKPAAAKFAKDQDLEVMESKLIKHPTEMGTYLFNYKGNEYKISKHLNNNERHAGEWSAFIKTKSTYNDIEDWDWIDTVYSRAYIVQRIKDTAEFPAEALVSKDPKLPNLKEPSKKSKYAKRKAGMTPIKVTEDPERVELDVSGNKDKGYVLNKILVPKDLRDTGIGTKAMKDFIAKADAEDAIIALTPSNAFGGAKTRLIQFYKRFGFVPNKGRNKDFRYRETMIRYPINEDVGYNKPDFDSEWEEATRYPEFEKMGKEAWIDLASSGRIINIDNVLSNLINNTDAGEKFRNTWNKLDADKKKRFVQALEKEKVELPIIARFSDGSLELIGGNTRLTGLMLNKGKAKAWIFNVTK